MDDKKARNRNKIFLYCATVSLFVFIAIPIAWFCYTYANNTNIDNSGMGLVIFLIPILFSVILLAVSLANRAAFKNGRSITNAVFLLMVFLSLPIILSCCLLLTYTFLIFIP